MRDTSQMLVLCMKENLSAVSTQIIIKFSLGPHNTFKGAKALKMRHAYIRYYSTIRLNNIHKGLYLARMIGAHLYYSQLMFGR